MALATSELPAHLGEVSIQQAMVLEEEEFRPVQLLLQPGDAEGRREFQLFSKSPSEKETWTLHARGTLHAGETLHADSPMDAVEVELSEPLERLKDRLGEASVEAFYETMLIVVGLGPSFQGLSALWAAEGEALGKIHTPPNS